MLQGVLKDPPCAGTTQIAIKPVGREAISSLFALLPRVASERVRKRHPCVFAPALGERLWRDFGTLLEPTAPPLGHRGGARGDQKHPTGSKSDPQEEVPKQDPFSTATGAPEKPKIHPKHWRGCQKSTSPLLRPGPKRPPNLMPFGITSAPFRHPWPPEPPQRSLKSGALRGVTPDERRHHARRQKIYLSADSSTRAK